MTKDVWVTVSGLQFVDDEKQEPMEVISAGEYYFKNGKHYILYDEVAEGFDGVIKNKIKINDESVEITKKGITNTVMKFEKGVRNLSSYQTPYGPLLMGIETHTIQFDISEDLIHIRMEYGLDIEEQKLSDCSIHIHIQSKENAQFVL